MTYPPQQPSYGQPGQPSRRNNRTILIIIGAVIGVFLLLCICGLVVALATGDDQPGAAPAAPAAATSEPLRESTAPPTPPAEPSPTGEPSATTPTSAAPKIVTMPGVVGQNAAVADDQLRKLGFTNIQYGSQDENDTVVLLLANWTVTKQSTKAGQKVPADTLIVITCTKQ